MKHVKIIIIGLGLLLVSVLAFSGVSAAQSVQTGASVTVARGDTVDSVLFAGGNTIDIAGTVNGDVYCGGQTVTISGTIHGDVICAGQSVTISGTVDGNIRVAGPSVLVSGTVSGSATVGAQTFILEKGAVIGRDLVGGTQVATISGTVGRDMAIAASTMIVDGQITRSVRGDIETLTVGSTGRIGGDLTYSSNNSPVVNAGGVIGGVITRTPLANQKTAMPAYAPLALTLVSVIYMFVTLLVVSLVIALLFPELLRETSLATVRAPGRTALIGFGAIVLVPALVLLLFMTVIGLPLGLLVLLAWLVILLLSGPFAAYTFGSLLLKTTKNPVVIMLLGATLLLVLYFIPLIGFLAIVTASIFGVGMLLPVITRRVRLNAPKSV